GEVSYAENVVIGGWKVGPEKTTIDIPTATLAGGELYTLVITGASYDELSCYYQDEDKDGTPDHSKVNID
nr:hypothetical protein [Treponema sp.]